MASKTCNYQSRIAKISFGVYIPRGSFESLAARSCPFSILGYFGLVILLCLLSHFGSLEALEEGRKTSIEVEFQGFDIVEHKIRGLHEVQNIVRQMRWGQNVHFVCLRRHHVTEVVGQAH